MPYDPEQHGRRSIRLKPHDYTRHAMYFVTICNQGRLCLFGEIVDGELRLNDAGHMVRAMWEQIPERYPCASLGEFIVMPNHFHALVTIGLERETRAPTRGAPTTHDANHSEGSMAALGDVIGSFKSMTTHAYIKGVHSQGWEPFEKRLWQRNYWEYIVRDEADAESLRRYIRTNPARWTADQLYQATLRPFIP